MVVKALPVLRRTGFYRLHHYTSGGEFFMNMDRVIYAEQFNGGVILFVDTTRPMELQPKVRERLHELFDDPVMINTQDERGKV